MVDFARVAAAKIGPSLEDMGVPNDRL
jgi:hypothetical protein